MSSNFYKSLAKIKEKSSNTTEQGTAFEKLSKIFFENDDIQKQQFSKVWHYKDWAKKYSNFSKTDIGIDLVGKLRDGSGFAAIQCKFFNFDHQITKEDLDSFVSASSSKIFTRLILIDTSNLDLGSNAKSMIKNLNKTYLRIQKYDLENSRIDWLEYLNEENISLLNKKEPRDHQILAMGAAEKHYLKNDRGKMIMACGTGKTYTSLKIAEIIANKKLVLYMVPSLALMSQSIREWKNDSKEEFIAFSACSDKRVGRKKSDNDQIEIKLNELAFPATTDSKKLAEEVNKAEKNKMIVVFSTYQSIEVITDAQKKYGMKTFDLIICDEAHRTTGATFEDEEDSYFVRIHEDKYVKGKKRLYMTATPRIFGNKAKQKADSGRVTLASMDDLEKYGEEFFNKGFNWAVENNLLSDYKVVILAIDENLVSANLQKSLEEGSELQLNDATKIIGVYKALAKVGFEKDKEKQEKLKPIKKALAFSQKIVISEIFQKEFTNVINEYIANENIKDKNKIDLNVEVHHIDGTFNADKRNERLNWLKADTEINTCRILSNVKCMSEGVDVPSLDAIMFLHPKKSQIDVVQAVGRVMRKAKGKEIGYVIIPVTVAPGVSPEKALNDSEKYKVVWQIVNALRTHDERLDSKVNMLSLGEDVSDKIDIIPISAEQEATVTKVEDVKAKGKPKDQDEEEVINLNEENKDEIEKKDKQISFELDDLSQAIKAKIVEKCGTREYWENWASDIAKIAQNHIQQINKIVLNSKKPQRKIFLNFLNEIRDDLNPEISENDAVEMLAQHIITKPVFECLFKHHEFTKKNPISKAIDTIVDKIYSKNKELENNNSLISFYKSVQRRAEGIITSKGRQKLITELYDRFFKNAFPLVSDKLGIVYTPIEIVDFINQSSEDILNKEFNKSFNDKNVNILDPFAGTGTFITRLLDSGIIKKNNLNYKYNNEIHTNEIVLLAYYIAGVNIESVFHDLTRPNQYNTFKGIVLTDTFQLYEQERDMIANLLPDNSLKRTNQKKRKITVIIGNPPYSSSQKKTNDNVKNINYPNLDEKIRNTYAVDTLVSNKQDLYDSYIRAFRWATDRLDDEGLIAFITGSSWLKKSVTAGLRKHFLKDFSKIYVINLRGDIRSKILSKLNSDEGENVFGQSSMTGITITFMLRKKNNLNKEIYYHDIGKNLKKEEKLKKLYLYKTIFNPRIKFTKIAPDRKHDWIDQGDPKFDEFIKIGDKKNNSNCIFRNFSGGIQTGRDPWVYNSSKEKLINNIKKQINFFNSEINKKSNKINYDKKNFSWCDKTKKLFNQRKKIVFKNENIDEVLYRPFQKKYLYRDNILNWSNYLQKKIFPTQKTKNLAIVTNGVGSRNNLSVWMVKKPIDLNAFDAGSQCFPLNIYDDIVDNNVKSLFETESENENISDYALTQFQQKYKKNKIKKEEIFYFIYGLLYSKDYREKFKNNLSKELPKIPLLKNYDNFKTFSKKGKELADIHLNFDKIPFSKLEKSGVQIEINDKKKLDYKVSKMKFEKNKSGLDKSIIIFNNQIRIKNIPLSAYDYIINGRSAIDWIIGRCKIKIDKDTGIVDDPNDFANEAMKNPAYLLELLQRVITMSLETNKIVKSLPKLDI